MSTPFTPQLIALGTTANDGTGDVPRAVGQKINANLQAIANLLNSLPAGQAAVVATALVAGLMKPGTTMTIAQDGTADVAGQSAQNLPSVGTLVGSLLTLLADPSTGALSRSTLAQQLAWFLANDGSTDVTQATLLSSVPSGLVLLGLQTDGTIVRVPSTLVGGSSSGGSSTGGGSTTPANATTYAISTASTGTAGTAQSVAVAVSGTLSSPVVVTLSDGAGGTFGGTVTLQAGTNPSGSTQYTPSSAGTRMITGTNNAGLTNPAGVSVTVAAAAASGGSTSALTVTNATYASRGDGSGKQMLTGGTASGVVPVTLPYGGGYFCIVAKFKAPTSAVPTRTQPFLKLAGGGQAIGLIVSGNSVASWASNYNDSAAGSLPIDGAIHEISLSINQAYENAYVDGVKTTTTGLSGNFDVTGLNIAIDMSLAPPGLFSVGFYGDQYPNKGSVLKTYEFDGNGNPS